MSQENELPEITNNIVAHLEGKVKVDGNSFEIDKDSIETIVEMAGTNMKDIKTMQKMLDTVQAGVIVAASRAATAAMKKDKALTVVSGNVALGRDRISVTHKRSEEVRAGVGKDAPVKQVIGHTTSGYKRGLGKDVRVARSVASEWSAANL